MLDSQFSGTGFESCSDHYLELFLGRPEFKSSATLVNSKLVCFRPVAILDNVMFNLNYSFSCLLGPTSACAIALPRVNKGSIYVINSKKCAHIQPTRILLLLNDISLENFCIS